ncbi:MAG: hypothetical protein UV05_C0056G0004 [candidate division CPR1 bacterium GW2011_GWA2_42_17]|uniref:Uncharacterized protein n=1 Tax=candidate division CPR1 bacterium GW2011_GWA2_42_17 TaxID=1618341 RepID=A0A0G0YXN8_9BACT|nr:MAG: hypothetical protein UV05_C0056G0004 [candidate division CPR1 bacterium GW2011_GWA2_42_17]
MYLIVSYLLSYGHIYFFSPSLGAVFSHRSFVHVVAAEQY